MSARIYVASLWAPDLRAALRFYRDVIGLTTVPHHAGRLHFTLNGAYLAVLPGKLQVLPDSPDPHFPLVAIAVDDFEAALARLEAEGIVFPWGVEEGQGLHWVKFFDPGGNLIELVDQGSEPA